MPLVVKPIIYRESGASKDEERRATVRKMEYVTCPLSQRMKHPFSGGGRRGVG